MEYCIQTRLADGKQVGRGRGGGCAVVQGRMSRYPWHRRSLQLPQETPWLGSGRERCAWSERPGFFRFFVGCYAQCFQMLWTDNRDESGKN